MADPLHIDVEQPVERGLLVHQKDTPGFLGVSRAALFRLKAKPGFPAPVRVPGIGVVFRRADLERWVANLKPDRQPRRIVPQRRAEAAEQTATNN